MDKLLISAVLLVLVSCTSAGEPFRTSEIDEPPQDSPFYEYRDQCGKPNLCVHAGDIGCYGEKIEGTAGDYIKDGTDAPTSKYPWMVVLFSGQWKLDCDGTLISARHVLTDRRCFAQFRNKGKPFDVQKVRLDVAHLNLHALLGAFKKSLHEFEWDQKKTILEFLVPLKVGGEVNHGFLMLRIEDAKFTDRVRPICLPFDGIPVAKGYSMIGWGNVDTSRYKLHNQEPESIVEVDPEYLQELKGLEVKQVKKSFGGPGVSSGNQHNGVNVQALLHVTVSDKQGLPCRKDSGSPLMWEDPKTGRYYIMGIFMDAYNDFQKKHDTPVCHYLNKGPTRTLRFTKVTYFMEFVYVKMNPDGYVNNKCLPGTCPDKNTTYITKGGVLSPPCGWINKLGTAFCMTGEDIPEKRNLKLDFDTKEDFLNNGFAECGPCTNKGLWNKNWFYQQWINEMTLGSFSPNRQRYHGQESPYTFFATSYLRGIYEHKG